MPTLDTSKMKKDTMQTTLVSDENYMRLKDLADEAGQTIEEMLESTIIQSKVSDQERLSQAAIALKDDYENDPELTGFTALDGGPFYDYNDEELKRIDLQGKPAPALFFREAPTQSADTVLLVKTV